MLNTNKASRTICNGICHKSQATAATCWNSENGFCRSYVENRWNILTCASQNMDEERAIPFNIHTPPMDEVFCLVNPQKITFTHDPLEISVDEFILLDTPQKYVWKSLVFLYTPKKCAWTSLSFLYTPQKCVSMRLVVLHTPQKSLVKQQWVIFLL